MKEPCGRGLYTTLSGGLFHVNQYFGKNEIKYFFPDFLSSFI